MMLQRLRDGTKSWVAGVFIFVIAASFAVWGIGDWIGGALVKDVATIGGKTITQSDYRRTYDQEMRRMQQQFGRVIQRDQARLLGVDQRVLATLLGTAAIELHSEELDLGVSDAAIAERIKRDPAFQGIAGGFDRDRYDQTLRFSGISEAAFVERQRQGLIRRQLTQTITHGVTVPDTLVNALNAFRNEERDVSYLIVTPAQATKPGEPTPEQLKTYYEENERRFTAPEYRQVAAIILAPKDFEDRVNVSDEDVRESFDARSREFNTPETRVVEQITFADKEAAQKGFDALKGGKTFDALADEQGREDRFISYGDVASTAILDSALAKAAFTLKEPGFTEPVSGDLSTSILRVTKITPAVAQKFEDVKAQVRTELIQERAVTRVADLYDQIEDDRGKGLTLEDISSKRDVNLTEVAAVDSSGKAPDGTFVKELPQNPALQRGISGAEIDLNADPVELGGDSFAFVEVKAITPEKLRPFDEVKDDVTSAWRAAEERLSVTKAAEGAVDKLNGGAPIADVAKALEVEVKTADKLKRASRTDDLPSGAVGRLFSLAKGRAASAELLGGQNRVVFVVTDITTPDKPLDAVATLIENQVSNQIGEEMVAEYLQALQSRYDVEVDQEAIVQATDPAGPAGGRGSF